MAGKDQTSRRDLLADSQELGRPGNDFLLPWTQSPTAPPDKPVAFDAGERATVERSPSAPVGRRFADQIDVSRKPLGNTAAADTGLRQYVIPLLRWWWLVLISVTIGALSGYLGTRLTPRVYQSRTTLMVGQALQNPNPSTSEFYTGQVLAQSYADLVKREPVLRGTLDALGLKWDWSVLQGMVSSRVVPGTQLLEISVLDADPQRVQVLTDEIAQQLILQSPAATDPEKEVERQFILDEIEEIKANIQKSRAEVRQLDDEIAKLNSARQIQDARNRQASLQTQIASWQATCAQLLTTLQKGTPNFLSVVERAQIPAGPVSAGTGINVLLGLAIGLVLSGGAAFLLEYIDDTIKTPDDVRQILGLATLGRIPLIDGSHHLRRVIVADQPRSLIAGAYRVLRTNLQFCAVDRALNTLMVTSTSPEEGKSVITANLAVAMAQSGQRVILVDADLWRPVQHRIFELNNGIGLTSVLKGDVKLDQALQAMPLETLQVLPSGPTPPNPSDLLGSRRMSDLIQALRQRAEVVIFDSPPVMADADATILATRVDGVLLVINSGTTRRTLAQRSREALNIVGAYLPGVALNRVMERSNGYYYYYSNDEKHRRKPSIARSLMRVFGRNKRLTAIIERISPARHEHIDAEDKTQ